MDQIRTWMRLVETETILTENYQFISRNRFGDTSADDLMNDVSIMKHLYKIGCANRYRTEQILVVQGYHDNGDSILTLDDGSAKTYPPSFYSDTKRLVNSVHAKRMQPLKFASWVRGMYRRSSRWRTHYYDRYKEIAKIIADEMDRLSSEET